MKAKDNTSSRQSYSGFTLIEVILAALILGVLSIVVVNGFTQQMHNAQLKQAVQSMINFTKLVKSKSLTSGSKCQVRVNHRQGSISVINDLECKDIGSLLLFDVSEKSNNITICGTTRTGNLSMACDNNIDGSDIDANGLPEESTTYEFGSTGHASKGALFIFSSPKTSESYCVIITTPVGLIRQGRIDSNDQCNFTR